jgi:hypothetical protein
LYTYLSIFTSDPGPTSRFEPSRKRSLARPSRSVLTRSSDSTGAPAVSVMVVPALFLYTPGLANVVLPTTAAEHGTLAKAQLTAATTT